MARCEGSRTARGRIHWGFREGSLSASSWTLKHSAWAFRSNPEYFVDCLDGDTELTGGLVERRRSAFGMDSHHCFVWHRSSEAEVI